MVADHQSQPGISIKIEPYSSISSFANSISFSKDSPVETDQSISFAPTKPMSTISKPTSIPTNTKIASCAKCDIPATSPANSDIPMTSSGIPSSPTDKTDTLSHPSINTDRQQLPNKIPNSHQNAKLVSVLKCNATKTLVNVPFNAVNTETQLKIFGNTDKQASSVSVLKKTTDVNKQLKLVNIGLPRKMIDAAQAKLVGVRKKNSSTGENYYQPIRPADKKLKPNQQTANAFNVPKVLLKQNVTEGCNEAEGWKCIQYESVNWNMQPSNRIISACEFFHITF